MNALPTKPKQDQTKYFEQTAKLLNAYSVRMKGTALGKKIDGLHKELLQYAAGKTPTKARAMQIASFVNKHQAQVITAQKRTRTLSLDL